LYCLCKNKFLYFLGLELQKRQSAVQNVDVLPTLSITDIDKKVIRIPIIQGQTGICVIYDLSIILLIQVIPMFNYVNNQQMV